MIPATSVSPARRFDGRGGFTLPDAEYTVRDQQRMTRAKRYFDWQHQWARRQLGKRVIEVGCGLGNFTQWLTSLDCVVCIDVEPACVDLHKARFEPAGNIHTFYLDILDERVLELRRFEPDSIVCLNVLEHVSDHRRALEHMHALLPPGGKAVFIVPAFEALYGPIDYKLGHYRRYSKKDWRSLAAETGFRTIACRYMNSVGFFGWWMNAKVLKKQEQSEGQIAVFDKLIVPVLSRVESVFQPPVGQSLFCVISRNA